MTTIEEKVFISLRSKWDKKMLKFSEALTLQEMEDMVESMHPTQYQRVTPKRRSSKIGTKKT